MPDSRIRVTYADGQQAIFAPSHFQKKRKRKVGRKPYRGHADGVLRTNAEWRQIREMYARKRGEL